ncbi:SRPBCC family protein [Phreatobacter stygius]|uniref:SRPBCC family protein n=1 Tax=Phreatobacter stygius TaxID=1940610 RepID=A0A4D7B351_9HYPH|nr:SRPBCC family protein [Phreatobacter stygius]QCI65483.1 SRPBCC family protein [Phreatobacter stygius]
MASIRRDILIEAGPDHVWAAVRDYGQVHTRLAPGFVTGTTLEGDLRVVTFASGLMLRELIVDVDDQARRLAWAAIEGRATHHNGSLQVFAEDSGASRLVWITDILPHELAPPIGAIMAEGMVVMKRTLEQSARQAA